MVQVRPGEVLALFSPCKRATVEEAQLVGTLFAHLVIICVVVETRTQSRNEPDIVVELKQN